MSKSCYHCKAENLDDAKFCGQCGKPFARRICPECGTEISTNFCTQCGRHSILAGPGREDVDGRQYKTVQIGRQEWMAENLAVTKDKYGNDLILGEDYFYPAGDASNVAQYGLLYTWYAAMRLAVPDGFHLPTDAEWSELEAYCGEHYALVGDMYYIAKALASTTGWKSDVDIYTVGNNPSSNNATGFGAMPAGYYAGSYNDFGGYAYFWSATEGGSSLACSRALFYLYAHVSRYYYNKYRGFSVRCLRDS